MEARKRREVKMTLTQNAPQEPVDPDAACEPLFGSEEIAQSYENGLLGRSEADVFDVLYSTGFAQEEC